MRTAIPPRPRPVRSRGHRQPGDVAAGADPVHHQHPAAGCEHAAAPLAAAHHEPGAAAVRGCRPGQLRAGRADHLHAHGLDARQRRRQGARRPTTSPKQFGKQYLRSGAARQRAAAANIQDAHEAVRPTDVARTPKSLRDQLDPGQFRLYDLIWRRFVASQMAAARFLNTRASLAAGDYLFRASGSVLQFDGFQKVWKREEEKDREEQQPARARERRAAALRRLPPRAALHPAAAALHGGLADQGARGARHRPAVDVRADHRGHPGAQLRAPGGAPAASDRAGQDRRRRAPRALPRDRRRRLHRRDGEAARRHRGGHAAVRADHPRVVRPVRARR